MKEESEKIQYAINIVFNVDSKNFFDKLIVCVIVFYLCIYIISFTEIELLSSYVLPK